MIRGIAYVVVQSLGGLVRKYSCFFCKSISNFSWVAPFSRPWCLKNHEARKVLVQLNLVRVSLYFRCLHFTPSCKKCRVAKKLQQMQGFGIEFVITFVLVMVVFGAAADENNGANVKVFNISL